MVGRSELTLAAVKRVLTVVCHRIEASRPISYVGIEGLLQLLGGVMTLVKHNSPPQAFDTAKEFMVSRLNHLKALCMTPVPSPVHDGEPVCGYSVLQCYRYSFSSWKYFYIHFRQ